MSEQVQGLIAAECDRVKEMLLGKNRAYGNSALEPMRVFSKASADEQIRVRLDDKLSRLARGSGIETEDVEADIIGYLVLMRVHRKMRSPLQSRCAQPEGAMTAEAFAQFKRDMAIVERVATIQKKESDNGS